MKTSRSKKNYFPEPKFQWRFLRLLLGGLVIQTVITCLFISYFVKENYTLLVQYGALESDIAQALYWELKILIAAIVVVFTVFLSGNFLLGVVFSHRIAGPIFALKRTIREILEGKDAELNFRNKDEFRELVDSFNEMVLKLRRGDIPYYKQKAFGNRD